MRRAARAGIGNWLLAARRAARLDHPNVAKVVDCGVHDHWPYVAVDRRAGITLEERLAQHPVPLVDDATLWIASVLRGLAFAHDAGLAHHDLQLHNIIVNERGQARVMALEVAAAEAADGAHAVARQGEAGPPDRRGALRAQRAAAERDVLAAGLVLHRLLVGAPALDGDDVARRDRPRMAPGGRELGPPAVDDAAAGRRSRCVRSPIAARRRRCACAIAARAPSSARSPDGAKPAAEDNGGPVALLLDRLHSVGHLPALPGLATRVQRVTAIESQRTDEIAATCSPTWRSRSSC